MNDEYTDHMGAIRWVSFNHYGEPESGEARTMNDGSVWARIVGLDPKGDDDRWVMLLDADGNEGAGVSDVQFGDVTVSMTDGVAPPLPDDMRARFVKTDFILDMYESGVYSREEAGDKLFDHLFGKDRSAAEGEGLKADSGILFFGIYRFQYFRIPVFWYVLICLHFLTNVDFVISRNVSLQDFILTNYLPDYLVRIVQ
ncbi:hypothetical protein ACLUXG_00315 [Bifidobacterium apri]|uniref:hypothetical protein n=1 Tax=Bifidobacterium apri TaxID=1769423 RepID=UPI0039923847